MQKEELRFAEAIVMAAYVMIAGTWQMPVLSVDNLDLMVWREIQGYIDGCINTKYFPS